MTFIGISSSFCHAILNSIGGQLLNLFFVNSRNIDLSLLAVCNQLEELDIDCDCSFKTTIEKPVQNFLPRLKIFVSYSCLGSLSPVFECRKSSLKKLTLICSHLGVPGVTHLNWSHVPDLWPILEEMHIFNASKNLTIDIRRLFMSRMKPLKLVTFP